MRCLELDLKLENCWWLCKKDEREIMVASEDHPKGGFVRGEAAMIAIKILDQINLDHKYNLHSHVLIECCGENFYVEVSSYSKKTAVELPLLNNKEYGRTSDHKEIEYFID